VLWFLLGHFDWKNAYIWLLFLVLEATTFVVEGEGWRAALIAGEGAAGYGDPS